MSLLAIAVVVLVLVEGSIILVNHRSGHPIDAGPSRPPSSQPATAASSSSDPSPRPAVTSTSLAVARSDLTGRWALLARGPGVVVRFEPSSKTVSVAPIPSLKSSGPVSFVATTGASLVRPLDVVPGYVVPDSGVPEQMAATLATDGPMLPGPAPDEVWVAGPAGDTMVLKPVTGGAIRGTVRVPRGGSPVGARPDGRGGILFTTPGGVFDGLAGSARQVTLGNVLAVGPTTWLVTECDVRAVCTLVAIAADGAARRSLGAASSTWSEGGVVSPDGRTAALGALGVGGRADLVLLDLTAPAPRPPTLPVDVAIGPGSMAWSPDGRWLFVVTAAGGVAVVDPRSGTVGDLGVTLPGLSQLAIRPS